MITLAASSLGALDWAVIGGYLLLLLGSGVWFARREPAGAREYFLAGRRMPAWAVSFSVIASALSVATFIGVPEIGFRGNMTFLSTTLGTLIAVAVVAGFFIPAFYAANVTTVYDLLERRFGTTTKKAASAAFMVGRVFASGARVYIAAIPLTMVLFGAKAGDDSSRLIMGICVLTVVAVLYTLIGGIASVIWTDVLQTTVLIGAAVGAVLVLLHRIPVPMGELFSALRQTDPDGNAKTSVLMLGLKKGEPLLGFDPSQMYTILTAVFGFSLINMAAYGTDHDLAQRMLTCKSAVRGSRSAWGAVLLNVPITLLFMVIGVLLYVYYKRPDLMGRAPVEMPLLPKGQQAFPNFILSDMPGGLSGLMLAGLFAAGLGSLNSAINAMAATFINDFYMPLRKGQSERHYLVASRWATAGWGLVIGGFGVACIFWMKANPKTTLIDFALSVMTFAYSGLLAVFLGAIFTKRGSTASSLAALVTGFVVIALFQPVVWACVANVTGHVPLAGADDALIGGWKLDDLKTLYPWLKLVYPWQMLLATTTSFVVCCLGSGDEKLSREAQPS